MDKKNNKDLSNFTNNISLNRTCVENFYWPISIKEVENFRNEVLFLSIRFLKKNNKHKDY